MRSGNLMGRGDAGWWRRRWYRAECIRGVWADPGGFMGPVQNKQAARVGDRLKLSDSAVRTHPHCFDQVPRASAGTVWTAAGTVAAVVAIVIMLVMG
jgi:predicted RecA/RadA family phage recombinase